MDIKVKRPGFPNVHGGPPVSGQRPDGGDGGKVGRTLPQSSGASPLPPSGGEKKKIPLQDGQLENPNQGVTKFLDLFSSNDGAKAPGKKGVGVSAFGGRKDLAGNAGEVLVSAPRPQVVTTWKSNGRPVREKLSDGTENVIAYDPTGTPRRFPDKRITTIPITGDMFKQTIPGWRRQQLEASAKLLMDRYKRPPPSGRGRPIMDYRDLGRMLREIASWKGMTNTEKAYLWSEVATKRRKELTIVNDYVPRAVIDSRSPENTANHIVLPFHDGYHGPMAAMSDEEALRRINDHESILGINMNAGDTEASIRMVRTFRAAYVSFEAFAEAWNANFVQSNR